MLQMPVISSGKGTYDFSPKPEAMGRYHSGRSDVSENADALLKNRIGRKKCL